MGQSQDDSIVGTKQCRHSVAIMPIPGNLSSSSPDLLQPATSVLDFSNPAGMKTHQFSEIKGFVCGSVVFFFLTHLQFHWFLQSLQMLYRQPVTLEHNRIKLPYETCSVACIWCILEHSLCFFSLSLSDRLLKNT